MRNIYVYMLIMFLVTYLIRILPLTLIRKEIKSTFIKSFLYYVPYVTLSVMTFPAIIQATNSVVAATIAFVVALVIAWFGASLFQVAVLACVVVFVIELTPLGKPADKKEETNAAVYVEETREEAKVSFEGTDYNIIIDGGDYDRNEAN